MASLAPKLQCRVRNFLVATASNGRRGRNNGMQACMAPAAGFSRARILVGSAAGNQGDGGDADVPPGSGRRRTFTVNRLRSSAVRTYSSELAAGRPTIRAKPP